MIREGWAGLHDGGRDRDAEVGGDGSAEKMRWSVFILMINKSPEYENHLLLVFPFAKQEGEQVTNIKKKKKQKERKIKN